MAAGNRVRKVRISRRHFGRVPLDSAVYYVVVSIAIERTGCELWAVWQRNGVVVIKLCDVGESISQIWTLPGPVP